jgi:hypothetical protein
MQPKQPAIILSSPNLAQHPVFSATMTMASFLSASRLSIRVHAESAAFVSGRGY